MINKRKLGRIVFSIMAATTTVGSLITFFDHPDPRKPLQSIAMAILTLAWIHAIKCLDD